MIGGTGREMPIIGDSATICTLGTDRTGDIVCRFGTNHLGSVIFLPTGSPTVPGYKRRLKDVRQRVFGT